MLAPSHPHAAHHSQSSSISLRPRPVERERNQSHGNQTAHPYYGLLKEAVARWPPSSRHRNLGDRNCGGMSASGAGSSPATPSPAAPAATGRGRAVRRAREDVRADRQRPCGWHIRRGGRRWRRGRWGRANVRPDQRLRRESLLADIQQQADAAWRTAQTNSPRQHLGAATDAGRAWPRARRQDGGAHLRRVAAGRTGGKLDYHELSRRKRPRRARPSSRSSCRPRCSRPTGGC